MNLEGRLQRQRRAVVPPATDETTVIAELGRRLGVEIPAGIPELFEELSARCYGGLSFAAVEDEGVLPGRPPAEEVLPPPEPELDTDLGGPNFLRLVSYRPLFSGPAVERVPELQFQRPEAEITLSARDAAGRLIAPGDEVVVSSNGTSVTLRARLSTRLAPGHALLADEHRADLGRYVEVAAAAVPVEVEV